MAMQTLVLLTVLVAMPGQLLGQQMVPCKSHQDPYTGPPLPVLPDQFQVHVEANIVQKNFTRNIVEYYDYPNNRAVLDSHDHTNSEFVRTVLDFTAQEARVVYENGTCDFMMTNSSSRHFGFLSAANGTHIRTVKELLYFSDEMGEKFVGSDERVRGILVDHWTACVSMPFANGTFNLDYYFSNATDYVIDGIAVQVPVRAVINGTGYARNEKNESMLHTFYHIYEFTDFHPGPIKDESVFEIPVGTYCHSDLVRKPAPKLPEQFSVGLEAMLKPTPESGQKPKLLTQQMYYDASSRVMRVDMNGMALQRDVQIYGKRPLSVVHDKDSGMRYIIDRWEGNCTVMSSRPFEGMVTPEDILAVFDETFLYQGRKSLRGLSVESWANFNTTDNTITEVLLQQQFPDDGPPLVPGSRQKRVPAPGRGANAPYVPVGIYSRKIAKNNNPKEMVLYNLYGFSNAHPDPEVFDVSECYEMNHKYTHMSINTEGTYDPDVLYNRREFVTALRSAIARGAGISVMRVTSITVEADTQTANQLRVFFKILDNSLSGMKGNSLPSLKAAKLNLASAISGGLNFDVQYPTVERNFQVVRDTLWEVTSMYKDSDSTIKRYSSGAMAGLALGMIVIGALLGLGAAYIIYKRIDTAVPYEITH